MNILFITQLFPYKKGDPNTSSALREFVEEWGKMGHIVKVVRPHFNYEKEPFPGEKEFSIDDNVRVQFVKPIRIPLLKYNFYNNNRIIDGLKFKPDVVICHLYNSYFTFDKIAKKLNIPLILGIHMSDIKISGNWFHRLHQKRIFKKASGFVTRSYAIDRLFKEQFPTFGKNTFIALSGLPDYFIENARKKLSEPYVKRNKLISVANLVKLKHIDLVIEALGSLPKEIEWSYTIVGDGPERERLEHLVRKFDLSHKITFTGRVERKKVLELLNDHDIFILPSYPETLGLVYLEAMACGNIVIGTKGWGIDGIVKDGINGFLCDAGRIYSIENSIRKAIFLNENYDFRKEYLLIVETLATRIRAKEYVLSIKKVLIES